MEGTVLYPLNALKQIYPGVYAEHVKKYEGRMFVMDGKVPVLNCLWNDVLHMSSVNPADIKREMDKVGIDMRGSRFYKIYPDSLEPEKTIVYLYKMFEPNHAVAEADFEAYDPSRVGEYSTIPEGTKDYYRDMTKNDKRPLLWHMIPHILYKGSIDVADLEIITV